MTQLAQVLLLGSVRGRIQTQDKVTPLPASGSPTQTSLPYVCSMGTIQGKSVALRKRAEYFTEGKHER